MIVGAVKITDELDDTTTFMLEAEEGEDSNEGVAVRVGVGVFVG